MWGCRTYNPTMLTAKRLRDLLAYNPETGVFTWRVPRGRQLAGARAGTIRPDQYRQIRIDGALYLEHRLAWLYVHGRWPVDEVDHRFGARGDNRIDELREATASQNQQNRAVVSTGVTWHARSRSWQIRIEAGGRKHNLGYSKVREEACATYLAAKLTLHPFYQPDRKTEA